MLAKKYLGGKWAWHLHTWDNAVLCGGVERGWREVGGGGIYTRDNAVLCGGGGGGEGRAEGGGGGGREGGRREARRQITPNKVSSSHTHLFSFSSHLLPLSFPLPPLSFPLSPFCSNDGSKAQWRGDEKI